MSDFQIGDKVKLKYNKIIKHPDYIKNKNCEEQHVIRYHNFIEANRDTVFIVESFYGHRNRLIRLKDGSNWLVHENDLELLNETNE